MSATTTEEKLPCDEVITVSEQRTIYKTAKWWKAVILGESFGKRFVAVYLWQNKNGEWKQKHKLKINGKDDWEKTKPVVDELVLKL